MKFVEKRDTDNPLVPGHHFLFRWVKPYAKKSSILDIGCWTGALEILFEKTECTLTGIDIEEEPLLYARKRFPKFVFKKASITEPLPFKVNMFDIVLYFMVIEHIPKGDELKSLKNINVVMKKGGLLFFNTMNNNLLSNLLDPAYFFGHRHYSRTQLENWLKEAGFRVEEVRYNAGFFTTFHMLLLYFFKHILKMREPRNIFLDKLMWFDYQNRGFAEIDIRARKMRDL